MLFNLHCSSEPYSRNVKASVVLPATEFEHMVACATELREFYQPAPSIERSVACATPFFLGGALLVTFPVYSSPWFRFLEVWEPHWFGVPE